MSSYWPYASARAVGRSHIIIVQSQLHWQRLWLLELLLAARSLPHTHPTAPQAVYDVRTAPAHLLTDPVRDEVGPGASGRFLSMSTITFDPGDMADYRARPTREW